MLSFNEEKLMRIITIFIGLLFIPLAVMAYTKSYFNTPWPIILFLIVYIGGPIAFTVLSHRLGFPFGETISFYLYILILPLLLAVYGLMVNVVEREIGTWKYIENKKQDKNQKMDSADWIRQQNAYNSLTSLQGRYAFKYLCNSAYDQEENIRRAIVIALGNYGDQKAIDILENVSRSDPADAVRAEAVKSLGRIRGLKPEAAATQNMT